MRNIKFSLCLIICFAVINCSGEGGLKQSLKNYPKNDKTIFVFADLKTNQMIYSSLKDAKKRVAPCSTFKIWNTLIGSQAGLILSTEDDFYKWDKKERSIPAWNQDLKFIKAFQYSCVPAFQKLARQIGEKRMKYWLSKIAYGNQDISSGIDIFWLPRKGTNPILISPEEQVLLLRKLLKRELPFSEKSLKLLKEVMFVKKTDKGELYGKTGSSYSLGWFVGFILTQNHSYVFACLQNTKGSSGLKSKAIIEKILADNKLL